MTIDEQVLGFCGNCRFPRYMKPKSAEYGLKIVMLNDATTSYMYHAVPDIGKSLKQCARGSGPFHGDNN